MFDFSAVLYLSLLLRELDGILYFPQQGLGDGRAPPGPVSQCDRGLQFRFFQLQNYLLCAFSYRAP